MNHEMALQIDRYIMLLAKQERYKEMLLVYDFLLRMYKGGSTRPLCTILREPYDFNLNGATHVY